MQPASRGVSGIYDIDLESEISTDTATLRGRSMSKNPIIPNIWKICAVAAVLFSVALIVLAYYTGNGSLPAADWVTTGLKYTAWVVGGSTVLSTLLLIPYYCKEKNRLELDASRYAARALNEEPVPLDASDEEEVKPRYTSFNYLPDTDGSDSSSELG